MLQNLKANPAAAVLELAGALAKGLRDVVKGAVLALAIDAGLKPFVGGVVDGVFDLLSDPKQLTKLRGADAVSALQKGAALILPYLKEKMTAGLPAVAKDLIGALVDDLQKAVGSADAMNALVKGTAKDFVARAVRVVAPPLVKAVVAAVPSSAQSAVRTVLETIQNALVDVGALAKLGTLNAASLAKGLAEIAMPLLKSAISGLTGVDPASIDAAIAAIAKAVADPAAAAKDVLQKAVEAIDKTLVQLIVRIEHSALRDLATGVVSLFRELVTDGGAKGLRASAAALWQRIANVGSRFVSTLAESVMPSAELRALVSAGIRGLEEFFADPKGVAGALAAQATTLLASAAKHVGGMLLTAVRDRISEPLVSTLLTGVVKSGLEIIADPARWQAVTKEGLGAIASSFAPAVESFVNAAIAKGGSKMPPALRGFVEATVHSMANLFGNEQKRAELVKSPGMVLARAGIDGLKSFVQGEVGRARAGLAVSNFVGQAFDAVGDLLFDEAARKKLAGLTAEKAFAAVVPHVQTMLKSLWQAAVPDADLRALAEGWISTIVTKVSDLFKRPGEIVAVLKEALTQATGAAKGLAPLFMAFVKAKITEAMKKAPPELVELVQMALGGLERFGLAMLSDAGAWKKQVGDGGKQLLRDVTGWLFGLAKKPIARQVKKASFQKFIFGLIDGLADIVADPVGMVDAIKKSVAQGAEPVLAITIPKLAGPIEEFLKSELVANMPKGVLAEAMTIIVNALADLLRKPADLVAIIKEVTGEKIKEIKARLLGFVNRLIGAFRADKNTKDLVGPMQFGVKILAEL